MKIKIKNVNLVRKVYIFLALLMLCCFGCEWRLTPSAEEDSVVVTVERYDRLQSLYLSTGDYSALQQMNTHFPRQTRTLIEDVLCIGRVNDPEINSKFLNFYQDTTLQMIMNEAERQYASMDDINRQLTSAFERLRKDLPDIEVPQVYAQIGALDQSIIVADGLLGISLDKYLGANYQLYQRESYGYTPAQRQLMTRAYIVPDCLGFFLLSLYPMPMDHELTQQERDMHIGKIQWVVNRVMDEQVFNTLFTRTVGHYMKQHKEVTVEQLLLNNNYRAIR